MKKKVRNCIRWVLISMLAVLLMPIDVWGGKKWQGPEWTEEVIVSTPAEFNRALLELQDGQAISLRPGAYEELQIHGVRYDRVVVIRSHDPDRPARIGSLRVRDSERLWFDGLLFEPIERAGRTGRSLIDIRDSWAIGLVGNTIRGSADGDHQNDPAGVRILRSAEILFAENRLHDLGRALILGGVKRGRISRNRFADLRSDGINLAGVQEIVIDGNHLSGLHTARAGSAGFLRFWQRGSLFHETSNVVIRNNVMLQGRGAPARGIFVGNQIPGSAYENFTIEDNIIYVSSPDGIALYDVVEGRVANNTLVAYPGGAAPRINLVRTKAVQVTANVVPRLDQRETTETSLGENMLTEGADPAAGSHPEHLFAGALAGPEATAASFLPRPGGPLDQAKPQRIGARLTLEDWPVIPRLSARR